MIDAISVLLVIISLVSLIFTVFNFYYPLPIIAISMVVFVSYLKLTNLNYAIRFTKYKLIALLFILTFCLLNTVLFHDTYTGGVDEGVYTNSAIYLGKNNSLKINEYINYPTGWINENDGTYKFMFYPSYVSWMAINISFFGKFGLIVANILPVFLSLILVFKVASILSKNTVTPLIALILYSTTFPMFWITRITYTENFSLFLVWFSIYSSLIYYKNRNTQYLVQIFLTYSVFVLCRLEGFVMLISNTLVLMYISKQEKAKVVKIFYLFLIPFIIFILYTIFNNSEYLNLFIGQINENYNKVLVPRNAENIGSRFYDPFRNHFPEFVYLVLSKYNLFLPIVFVPISIFVDMYKKNFNKLRKSLIVIIITSPTFFYLYKFYITPEQPYFLRRFFITIIPVSIIFFVLFLENFQHKRKTFYVVFFVLLIINLIISSPIIFFSENVGMKKFVEEIAMVIGDSKNNSIIFVDQYSTGRYKVADPLYFIHNLRTFWVSDTVQILTVYQNINSNESKEIYLITNSLRSSSFIKNSSHIKFVKVFNKNISYRQLLRTVDLNHIEGRPDDVYDISFQAVVKMISLPNKIIDETYDLEIYKIYLSQ